VRAAAGAAQVLKEMSPEPPLQLVSFHSTSKGFLGECGLRGGYLELCGFDPEVQVALFSCFMCGICLTLRFLPPSCLLPRLNSMRPMRQAQLLKLVSIGLCSNTLGQIATGLMVHPPRPGDPSYATYVAERDGIMSSLQRRAQRLVSAKLGLDCAQCSA